MQVFKQKSLVDVLSEMKDEGLGTPVISAGRARDGFELSSPIASWVSGFGGNYEMEHSNVPAGTMIAVGGLEDLDLSNFEKLKEQLKNLDVYPTGHSGDFKGYDVSELRDWFFERSMVNNAMNGQGAIAQVQKLTPEGLGADKYTELVDYLAENMDIFGDKSLRVIDDAKERAQIVTTLLNDLTKTVRYTRLDEPATAFQLTEMVMIVKPEGGIINYHLTEANTLMILREYKNGERDISPLNVNMIGMTYVTADRKPLGSRGEVSLTDVRDRVCRLEHGSPVQHPNMFPDSPVGAGQMAFDFSGGAGPTGPA